MVYAVALVLCIVLRWLPHPFNFTPLGASAVFAGKTLPARWALPITWLGMLIANAGLSLWKGYSFWDGSMAFVFAGIGLQTFLGRWLRNVRAGTFAAAFLGGLGFYFVSNLGVFWTTNLYPQTALGLQACLVAGLPFLKTTLAGDLLWTLALTPVYRWAIRRSARVAWTSGSSEAAPV